MKIITDLFIVSGIVGVILFTFLSSHCLAQFYKSQTSIEQDVYGAALVQWIIRLLASIILLIVGLGNQ